MARISAIPVGTWHIAYHHSTSSTLLQLEWTDRDPLNLAIPKEHAIAIAQAILENYKTPPPQKNRLS